MLTLYVITAQFQNQEIHIYSIYIYKVQCHPVTCVNLCDCQCNQDAELLFYHKDHPRATPL